MIGKWTAAKRAALGVGVAGLVLFSWRRGNAGPEELDPVKVSADTHKVVFENQFVRVLEAHVPPGKVETWHKHNRRVVIDLEDFTTRSTVRGEAPKESFHKAGTVRWSDAVVHQVENIGKTSGHVFSVELK